MHRTFDLECHLHSPHWVSPAQEKQWFRAIILFVFLVLTQKTATVSQSETSQCRHKILIGVAA